MKALSLNTIIISVNLLTFVSCGGGEPDKPVAGKMSSDAGENQKQAFQLWLQKQEKTRQYNLLFNERSKLNDESILSTSFVTDACKVLKEKLATCSLDAPLFLDQSFKKTCLEANKIEDKFFDNKLKVQIENISGPFSITLNQTWKANFSGAGVHTVTFVNDNKADNFFPSIRNISSLSVVKSDGITFGTNFPKISITTPQGQVVLFNERLNKIAEVEPGRLEFVSDKADPVPANCVIDQSYFLKRLEENKNCNLCNDSMRGMQSTEWKNEKVADLLVSIKEIDLATQKITPEVNSLKEKTSTLKLAETAFLDMLTKQNQAGCFLKETIQSIDIDIKGTHAEPSPTWETGEAVRTSGKPNQIKLVLGTQNALQFTQADEEISPVFTPGGSTLNYKPQGMKVSDFNTLSIVKGGSGFTNQEKCWNTFLVFKTCGFLNQETHRYELDSITIRINNELVYESSNVNFTFAEGRLEWKDANLFFNSAYLKARTKNECAK